MRISAELLRTPQWTLIESRRFAAAIGKSPRKVRPLIALLFSENPELRVRAADVARRITERDTTCLSTYADEIIGALSETPLQEPRARWHLALVAARSSRHATQITRLAPMLLQMMNEASNVVRCSAIEGLAELALRDGSLRLVVRDVCYSAQLGGTPAMRSRARHAVDQLKRAEARPVRT